MIAVTQHHGVGVALPPVLERHAVVVGILPLRPAVEGLVHHQHAQPVADVQERRRRRIVRGSDGIETGSLQDLHPPFLRPVEGRRSQRTVVVMHAAAGHLHHLAVQQETLLDGPLDRADAEQRGHLVEHLAAADHARDGSIQAGALRRPQRRLGDSDLLGHLSGLTRLDGSARLRLAGRGSRGAVQDSAQRHGGGCRRLVGDAALDRNVGLRRADFRSRDGHAPVRHMHRFGDVEPDVPVDARA